eukprot:TRINITY_DN19398_c0_g1_i1.p1 TRINITY_DN19398_c0_g1~~TRINITY_DN19398_c0_g1_i1.p1  ORF type:complete len:211 (+),score=40.40 TRINITY_DN19398_c0_g1_i1:41-634(+)
MSKQNILIIVGDYVEDYEVMVPFQCLLTLGYLVDVVSPNKTKNSTVKTAIHDFLPGEQTYTELKGHNFTITKDWEAVNPSDYVALLIPGGRAPEFLRGNDKVLEIVSVFMKENKPVGALCHGPMVLTAIPGLLKGRKVTAYPALKVDMVNAGAVWVDGCSIDGAVRDGNLVTGCAWPGHPAWLREILVLLKAKVEFA